MGALYKTRFYGEELLAPRPKPRFEDHFLFDVRDCLLILYAGTFHIGSRSSIRNLEDPPCLCDSDPQIMDLFLHNF